MWEIEYLGPDEYRDVILRHLSEQEFPDEDPIGMVRVISHHQRGGPGAYRYMVVEEPCVVQGQRLLWDPQPRIPASTS